MATQTQAQLQALVRAGLLETTTAAMVLEFLHQQSDGREVAQSTADNAGAAKFRPADADTPVADVPDEVIVTADDVDEAIAAWDDIMPDYAGLLEAR